MKRLLLITLLLPLTAFATGLLLISLLLPIVALAAEADFALVIKDHHFQTAELTIPSGTNVTSQLFQNIMPEIACSCK